jgi:hypothetical protein
MENIRKVSFIFYILIMYHPSSKIQQGNPEKYLPEYPGRTTHHSMSKDQAFVTRYKN